MQRQTFLRIIYVALTIVVLSLTLLSSARAAEYKAIYKFTGGADGGESYAGLIFDAAGNLYGTTFGGGGMVFKLTPQPDGSWTHSVLHTFNYDSGPHAGLIFDAAGNLYGTTYRGGAYDRGTVFKLTPQPDGSWTHSVLHDFNDADGAYPIAGLIFDAAGNLYGTTYYGGAHNRGTVFTLTPKPDGSWTEGVIHSFARLDGRYPYAGLIFDAAGNLYGTTVSGGAYGHGTAFKLTPQPDGSWKRSKLHTFKGADGESPSSGLIFDAAGNLYGTTSWGGAYGNGTAFKLAPQPDGSWKRSKLHIFKGADGAAPMAELIFDAAGNLYGTTDYGGAYGHGTAFKLTPQPDGSWKRSKLHIFNYADGALPNSNLIFDAAGNLYGTTCNGGHGLGVVFKITP